MGEMTLEACIFESKKTACQYPRKCGKIRISKRKKLDSTRIFPLFCAQIYEKTGKKLILDLYRKNRTFCGEIKQNYNISCFFVIYPLINCAFCGILKKPLTGYCSIWRRRLYRQYGLPPRDLWKGIYYEYYKKKRFSGFLRRR